MTTSIYDGSEGSCREILRNADGTVWKAVHFDDSETSVKKSLSLSQAINPLSGKIETFSSERSKYSVFASTSSGCFMKCPFCHLTSKKARFSKLSSEDVLENILSAVRVAVKDDESLRERFVKLSWMGMGDAGPEAKKVLDVSLRFLDAALSEKLCAGLDGVDISSVWPDISGDGVEPFAELNARLHGYPRNPASALPDNSAVRTFSEYEGRSPFRFFLSVLSALPSSRETLAPMSAPLSRSAALLSEAASAGGFNLIAHHVLLEGRNDSDEEIDALVELMNGPLSGRELRILRYNHCSRGEERESEKVLSLVRRLAAEIPLLKVQVSPGSEVSAACGQFLVRRFVSAKSSMAADA